MRGYIIRRLLLIIPTLFFFSTIVFFAVRFLPGDIVSIMLSKYRTAAFDREQIARQLGVDVPMHVQYIRWIRGILLHGDFGRSLDNQRPVTEKYSRAASRPWNSVLSPCWCPSSSGCPSVSIPPCGRIPPATISLAASPSFSFPPPSSLSPSW